MGDALALLDRLQSRLTGEEWLYVGYRRQVAAHPFQSSYGVNLKEHGTALKTEHGRPILRPGVRVTVHEEDLALNHVLASVGGDEVLIPRRLALLAGRRRAGPGKLLAAVASGRDGPLAVTGIRIRTRRPP